MALLGATAPAALANCGSVLTLAPPTQTHTVGETATVTGKLIAKCKLPTSSPITGKTIMFTITSGPNAGVTGSGITDNHGVATFTYSSTTPGTDSVVGAYSPANPVDAATGGPVTVIWKAQLVYTGDAWDARATLKLPLLPVNELLFVNHRGPVSTTAASDNTVTVAPIVGPPLSATVLKAGVVTGSGQSKAEASIATANLGLAPLPAVAATAIDTTSTSTCASKTGTTTIAFLQIGGTVVVGPGGLLPPGAIPPNTAVAVPGVASVVLNEQIPITDGLAVNAIHVNLLNALVPGGVLDVTVAHAESDIHNC